jgi:HEAT repeat protein
MVLDALLTMDSERAMPTLKSVLARRDECSAVLRRKAVFLVSRKRTPETEDLLVSTLRTDPDKGVREQAVFWLGQVKSEKSTSALLEVLRTSQDEAVLEKAVFALGQQRNERAQSALRDLARRSDVAVAVRGQVIFWLGQRSGSAEESVRLLMELYPTLNNVDLQQRVLFALSQRKTPEALAFLREVATSSREPMEVRRTALFHAGQAGLGTAPLLEILRASTDRDFRQHVVFVIGAKKNPEAVDALMEIVKSDTDVEVRKTAIFWLGQSKDPRASEFLLTILNR